MKEITASFKFELGDMATLAGAIKLTQGTDIPAFCIVVRCLSEDASGSSNSYIVRVFSKKGSHWFSPKDAIGFHGTEYNSFGHFKFLEQELVPLPKDWGKDDENDEGGRKPKQIAAAPAE